MKYFGLAAAALVMTISASATTVLVSCGGFSASGTGAGGYFSTSAAASGAVTCPVFNSLPAGSIFVSEQLILQTDYSSGNVGPNGISTAFTPGTLAMLADTLTATGLIGSTNYADNLGPTTDNYAPLGSSYFIDLGYSQTTMPTLGGTVNYATTITSGQVQTVSGNVFELITYTSAVPEPGSMILLGGGLIAASLIGRKKFARK